MKILLIGDRVDPSKSGGIETFCRTIKKMFFTDIVYIGYEPRKKGIYDFKNDITIRCRGIFKPFNRLTKNKLRELMMKKKINSLDFDIAVLNFPKNLNFLLNNRKNKKILIQHTCFERYFELDDYLNKDQNIISLIKNELDCFVFLSEYDRQTFIKNLGLDYNRTAVIRHSSEMPLLEKNKEKNKKLIMIARLENSEKRFDLAIRAMKKLPDFTLDIYGGGEKGSILLNNLIKEEKLSNVRLCGPTNEVQKKLDESAIFVMTSDYEGYGITLIEAMRRGLPLIVRDTYDAAKDIVIDNGILLQKEWNEDEFVEGIKKIYDNYEYYSQNSLKIGKRHNFDIIKNEWQQLFKNL